MEVENPGWTLNQVDKSLMNKIFYIVSKHLFTSYLLIMKENSDFTTEKPGEHHFTQVIKTNVTNTNAIWIMCSDMILWEE